MELDKTFYKKLVKGDRRTQNLFYEMTFDLLMRIAIRYRSNVDDAAYLVNEAFIKILKNIDKVDHGRNIAPWLKTIMINTAIDDYRKNVNYNQISLEDSRNYDNSNLANESIVLDEINDEYLQDLLNKLPRATCNVFNLHVVDGYSHKEIAEKLVISVETSKWHVKQARKKLKTLFSKRIAI